MLKEWGSYVKNERGSQALQFLGLFPLVILSMLIIWQVGLISYTVVVAEAAARDGAKQPQLTMKNGKRLLRTQHLVWKLKFSVERELIWQLSK